LERLAIAEDGVHVDLVWQVTVLRPILRFLAALLRPALAWNHRCTTPRTEKGLREYLAATKEPSPPGLNTRLPDPRGDGAGPKPLCARYLDRAFPSLRACPTADPCRPSFVAKRLGRPQTASTAPETIVALVMNLRSCLLSTASRSVV
jgi:hypothetical protein